MDKPKIALKKLQEILNDWSTMDTRHVNGAYAAARAIATELRRVTEHDKLETLIWHIDAAFGADDTNGHPSDQHLRWAHDALDALNSFFTSTSLND